MAQFRTGDTLVFPIGPTLDDSGAAVTGATWSATVARKPDGTSFSPTYAELSNGLYLATVTSTQRGRWLLYSSATVSGVTYQDFGVIDVDDGIAGSVIFAPGPVEVNGVRTIYQRNDYDADESRSLDWSTSDAGTWPDLTDATIAFSSKPSVGPSSAGISATGSVTTPSGATKAVRVELAAADTLTAKSGTHSYQVRATLSNGDVVTLATGTLNVVEYIG